MVLQFSLVAQLSDYDTNKHRNIVEHINWVLSELSVGVHKTVNRIGRTCISLLSRTHRFSCILSEVLVTVRFDVLLKLLNVRKTINCKVRYIYCKQWRTQKISEWEARFTMVWRHKSTFGEVPKARLF